MNRIEVATLVRSQKFWEQTWRRHGYNYPRTQDMLVGHTAGWRAAMAWIKKSKKDKCNSSRPT